MKKQWQVILVGLVLGGLASGVQEVQAASYTASEQAVINRTKQQYAKLPTTRLTKAQVARSPFFGDPYNSYRLGATTNAFQRDTLTIYNFYRQMFNLAPVKADANLMRASQQASEVMAYTLPFQHGVSGKKPWNVHQNTWNAVDKELKLANLHTIVPNLSLNQTAVSFLADHTNVSGANAGHRLNLLNPGLKAIGVGMAFKNGAKGTSNLTMDVLSQAPRPKTGVKLMAYPQAGAFPIELLPANTPLSLISYDAGIDAAAVNNVQIIDHTTGGQQILNGNYLFHQRSVQRGNQRTLTYGSGLSLVTATGYRFTNGHRYTINYRLANGKVLSTTNMTTYTLK